MPRARDVKTAGDPRPPQEDRMGTRTLKIVLVLAILLLALARLAWAEAPATEQAAPAVAPAPVVVAEATCPATPSCPATADGGVAPELLGVTQNARGTVYYYDDRRWEAWATLGANDGLRPTAQVDILRKGGLIARGVVKSVKACDAIITPCEGTPAGAILLGDDVRVTCNGTRAELDKVIAREHRAEMWGDIGLTALLAACIFAERYGWFQLN